MSGRAGKLVLPRYNSSGSGSEKVSPNLSPSGSAVVVGGRGGGGSWEGGECGHSVLLDIEGGNDETTTGTTGATWWRADRITSPIKTAVFTHLGSAVSSGWSRARGAVISSATITSAYIRRVPALEKPFDLKEASHTGDPNDI